LTKEAEVSDDHKPATWISWDGVSLTVCIDVPPEMARIRHLVEITTGREAAMIRIGNEWQGRACLRKWT
jgi:hypothetical protein